MTASFDLTKEESRNVKAALQFLRRRFGGWTLTAKALHMAPGSLMVMGCVRGVPTVTIAFRISKLMKVTVDDVLTGRFPAPGTCPYCGHLADEGDGPDEPLELQLRLSVVRAELEKIASVVDPRAAKIVRYALNVLKLASGSSPSR